MSGEILFKEGELFIQKHKGIPASALDFLESISWGNEGAVYTNMKMKEHIHKVYNPSLYAIHEGDQILGTAVFCNTPMKVNSKSFNTNYIKYFASSPLIRGKGIVTKTSKKVMELIRKDIKEKSIFYACIERANRRSYSVVESAGYEDVGTVKTMGFSRFFPKNRPIDQIKSETDKQEVLSLLNDTYKKHALVQFNSIFMDDHYFVIRKEGKIVAGCQYHRGHWRINKMKGFMGKILMNVVPYLPLLKDLYNPKRFEFLVFEGIYVKNGFEKEAQHLFESLLAKEKLKSSMIWMGEDCPIRLKLVKKGNLGLLHHFVKESDVSVLASFANMTAEEIKAVHDQPLYASGFDYT